MGWKRVAWAGCLAPALGGCNIAYYATHNLVNEHLVKHTQARIDHELRGEARAAWREVRCQFPRRAFSPEFRDGFLDGYADYLDRGGNAQPPAVPPVKYTRHAKYYSPEGHALIKDYYLGFKYGVDVAVATGQRQFLTVPVLLPEKDTSPPVFDVQPGGVPAFPVSPGDPAAPPVVIPAPGVPVPSGPPPVIVPGPGVPAPSGPPVIIPAPLPAPRPLPGGSPNQPSAAAPRPPSPAAPSPLPTPRPLPPEARVPVPATPDVKLPPTPPPSPRLTAPVPPAVSKGSPVVPPADPETLPRPNPPLPTLPAIPALPESGNAPFEVSAPRPDPAVRLPEPPAEVPTLRDDVPTPPVWDEIPVVKPEHTTPPPLPANLTPLRRK